jgi:hypothetical protein
MPYAEVEWCRGCRQKRLAKGKREERKVEWKRGYIEDMTYQMSGTR